jgi:hypothetical protein
VFPDTGGQAVPCALSPPVTAKEVPLTIRAASEARKTTTGATSSGSIQGTPRGDLAVRPATAVGSSAATSPVGWFPASLMAWA